MLTDLLLEDYQNFPEVHQLGEESARFIRNEMRATWGQDHLTVLSEEESQCWLLGVSYIIGNHIFYNKSNFLGS